jgi:hypothetical protein
MLLEAISFSFNLGIFTCLFWNLFSFQNKRLIDKLKKIPVFLGFSLSFYSLFYLSSRFDTKLFQFKVIYFNGYTILSLFVLIGVVIYVSKKSFDFYAPLLSILLSPYIFFLLFGFEEITFGEIKIISYSLLKTQNPMIGLSCLLLLFIKPIKIQIPALILSIGFLFYQINPLKEFPFPEIKTLHYKYIPHEIFLKENAYLFEENSGIYTEKKEAEDDKLYKFTMKPIKKINLPLKQDLQYLISSFEFPILIAEGDTITVLELFRSYNHSVFKVIFHIQQPNKQIEVIGGEAGFDTATVQIEGPIF